MAFHVSAIQLDWSIEPSPEPPLKEQRPHPNQDAAFAVL
jgi:hypothetical protein